MAASPPADAVKGAHDSLFVVMDGLGAQPSAGRLLRGLTPYLDDQGARHVFLFTERRRREPWSGSDAVVSYQEIVHWARDGHGGVYRGTCGRGQDLRRQEVLEAFHLEPFELIDWAARRLGSAIVSSDAPLRLGECYIDKPWGREVWYTGVEARGVSTVRSTSGETGLIYALGMFPVPVMGAASETPILLKVLEPLPDAELGDLYLEVHREKWEVYVVLSVDPGAWPGGKGAMRAGLAPAVIEEYQAQHGDGWPAMVEADLLATIRDYQAIRTEIDTQLETIWVERGLNPAAPPPLDLRREALMALPDELREQETARREAVHRFLERVPLAVGDVARLPPGSLHSLLHGVRVVEFQTPTYERLIAMFGQKVLTQPHWDSEAALTLMDKAPYSPPLLDEISAADGQRVERVVDFPQFQVHRVSLDPAVVFAGGTGQRGNGDADSAAKAGACYQLLFVTSGKGRLVNAAGAETVLSEGEAYLLPAALGDYSVRAGEGTRLTYLLSWPVGEAPPAGGPSA